jgi:hypothetical protein
MHAYAPPELSEPAITRIRFVAMFGDERLTYLRTCVRIVKAQSNICEPRYRA